MQAELFPELEKPTDSPEVAGCAAMPCCAAQFGRVMNGYRLVRANYHPKYGILREIRGETAVIVPFEGNHVVWPTVQKTVEMDVAELASRQPDGWFRHNACVSDGPADALKSPSSAEGPFAARNG